MPRPRRQLKSCTTDLGNGCSTAQPSQLHKLVHAELVLVKQLLVHSLSLLLAEETLCSGAPSCDSRPPRACTPREPRLPQVPHRGASHNLGVPAAPRAQPLRPPPGGSRATDVGLSSDLGQVRARHQQPKPQQRPQTGHSTRGRARLRPGRAAVAQAPRFVPAPTKRAGHPESESLVGSQALCCAFGVRPLFLHLRLQPGRQPSFPKSSYLLAHISRWSKVLCSQSPFNNNS